MDLRLGRKLAKVICTEGESTDAEHDSRPERIFASASGFCVLCGPKESAYDEGGAETQHAEIYFFDHRQMLCHLFPGIEARVTDHVSAEELFETLPAEQMAVAPEIAAEEAVGGEGTRDSTIGQRKKSVFVGDSGNRGTRSSLTSLQRQRASAQGEESISNTQRTSEVSSQQESTEQDSAALRRTSERKPAEGPRTSLSLPESLPTPGEPGTGDDMPSARLTAANIQQICAKQSQGIATYAAPGAEEEVEELQATMRLIPLNWELSTRNFLRKGITEKTSRQARIQRRMDYLRKELELTA